MQINAINNFNPRSLVNKNLKQDEPQPPVITPQVGFSGNDDERSRKAAKSLRNAALGLMMAAATLGGTATLGSCTVDDDDRLGINVDIKNFITVFAIPSKPDTVHVRDTINIHHNDTIHHTDTIVDIVHKFDTIPIYVEKDYYCPVGDSIIEHAKIVDTPIKGGGNSPMPLRFGGFDPYHQAFHDLKFLKDESSPEKMVFLDKISVYMKDSKHPETKYAKYEYSTAHGKGVYVQKYKPKNDNGMIPEKWGWEPNGEVIETNHGKDVTISTIDANGNLEHKGVYEKGKKSGNIFLTSVIAGTNPQEEDYQEITNMFMEIHGTNRGDNANTPFIEVEKPKD